MASRYPAFVIHLTQLYPSERFFGALGGVIVVAAASHWLPPLFWLAVGGSVGILMLTLADAYRLYLAAAGVTAVRQPPRVFSLGDELPVRISVENVSSFFLHLTIIDELPAQLQLRDHRLSLTLGPRERKTLAYGLRPLSRGVYKFGAVNVFLNTRWCLAERRLRVGQAQEVAVYPSIVQMERFAPPIRGGVSATGNQRARTLAKSYAFDQIRAYVRGDDLRRVNWKATARRGEVMVNQYDIERAQRVYCLIDKGRTMGMPFGGLSLLDHAINAALAVSKVVLQQQDRAGLLTFSDKLGDVLVADGKPDQLRRILETLYRQKEREGESSYDLLYQAIRRWVPARSLLLLFTHLESAHALDRVLPALRRIARYHTLLVVLFEDTEVTGLLDTPTSDAETVYRKGTARRYLLERQLVAARLRQNGIQVLLVRPEALTGAVISRYLEMRGRGGL